MKEKNPKSSHPKKPFIRIAMAQMNAVVGDLEGNARKILLYHKRAAKINADIVVYPEMTICGYPPEDLVLKNHFVEDVGKTLKKLARKIQHPGAFVGFVDRGKDKKLYNAAALLTGGSVKAVYRKQMLPNYGIFDEKRYFAKGKRNFIFQYDGFRFGIGICEDIWSEKGPYGAQVKSGADFLINLSASPYRLGKRKNRENIVKKRAKTYNTYISYTNLVGGQDELVFDGGSFIVDPRGKIVASATEFSEAFLTFDIPQKNKISNKKVRADCTIVNIPVGYSPHTQSANPPFKQKKILPIEELYGALRLGTCDYVKKNGFSSVVIGLSGGIDSALTAAIAKDAIGADNVYCLSMPSRYSSKGTIKDARRVANNLGAHFDEISIEKVFKAYLDLFGAFRGGISKVARENIQARIRGNMLMALSNTYGRLVLTTGNKSEMAVGYATLYGDMAGGFAVIKDVPKTRVYELALFFNKKEGSDIIPQSMIDRAPSAELSRGQRDSDTLPSYRTLDPILLKYIEKDLGLKKIISAGFSKKTVEKVIAMIDRNEYKRRQSPPGIKVSSKAFGKDRRLPLTNNYKEF